MTEQDQQLPLGWRIYWIGDSGQFARIFMAV